MKRLSTISALLISVFFILLWGCAGKKQPKETEMQKTSISTSLDSSFQLMHNQTAVIESENLSVKFLNVAEDSRCPVGVICVWQGQAKIELEIKQKDRQPENLTLTSLAGRDELAEKEIDGYFIRLLTVEPSRKPDQELTLPEYRITLIITGSR